MTRSDVHSGPTLPEAIQLARFHVDSLHIGAEGELWTVYDSSLDGYLEALGGYRQRFID